MEYRDYYATLGLSKDASQADVKKAFRRLARKHHPDVNKGDAKAEQRFKELSEANEVLSDPKKRKAYDQLGANWAAYQGAGAGTAADNPCAGYGGFASGAGAGGAGGIRFEYHGNAEDLAGFSDFFRTFFTGDVAGGATSARSAGRGRSARTTEAAEAYDFEPLFGGLGGVEADRGQRQLEPSLARLAPPRRGAGVIGTDVLLAAERAVERHGAGAHRSSPCATAGAANRARPSASRALT